MDDDLKDEICPSTANKFDHEKVKSAVSNLKLPANDDESRRLQNEMWDSMKCWRERHWLMLQFTISDWQM